MASTTCQRRIPTPEPWAPLITVAAAGLALDPAGIPELYRAGVHVCFPPSRCPCWCGGWHEPDDPADFVIVAGPDARRWRFGDDRFGLAIVPAGQPSHPDFSTLHVPTSVLPLTTTQVIEQIAEGLLVPGLCGYDSRDLPWLIEPRRQLHFAHAATVTGVLDAGRRVLARASGWLPNATNLLVRHTSNEATLLHDLGLNIDRLLASASRDTSAVLYATISPGSPVSVVAVLAAS